MYIRHMTKSDFDYLLTVIDNWWGWPTSFKFHPVYLYQFGNTAFVMEDNGKVVGFVVGFISQTDPQEAYIHLVATEPQYRTKGIARTLYKRFFTEVFTRGCCRVRAITIPTNRESIAFHKHMGFRILEDHAIEVEGVKAVKNYSGPGQHRVVFIKDLKEGDAIGKFLEECNREDQ